MISVEVDGENALEGGNHVIISSGMRVYGEWYRCCECEDWVWFENVVWLDGDYCILNDDHHPFHEDCAPNQFGEV